MDITSTAGVVAVQSVESTPATSSPSAQLGASSNLPDSSRLLNRITSSNGLTGIEKNGLIGTVSLIDKLKSTDVLRKKLLKDVAAVTTYLERTASTRVRQEPVQKVDVVKIAEKIAKEVQQHKPTDVELQKAITGNLEKVVQAARGTSLDKAIHGEEKATRVENAARVENAQEFALPGSGDSVAEIRPVGSNAGEVINIQLTLPGSGETDIVVEGLGAVEEHLVEIQIPGAGDADGGRALARAEGSELTTAQLIDKLV